MRHHIHHFFGRHHDHGRFGRFGSGPWDEGGRGGRGFGMGRKLASADLQLIILALLDEKPHYGYEIIKALELRSQGFYVPSPGMVYPALTYLEELGHATVEADGARKLYRITASGRTHVAERREMVDAMFAQFDRIGQKMARVRQAFSTDEAESAGESSELHSARHELRNALRQCRDASPDESKRIAAILKHAAEEISAGRKS